MAEWRNERENEEDDDWDELSDDIAKALGYTYDVSEIALSLLLPEVRDIIRLIETMTVVVQTMRLVDKATDVGETLDRINTPAQYFEGVITEISDVGDRSGHKAARRLSSRPNVDLSALDEAFGLLGH